MLSIPRLDADAVAALADALLGPGQRERLLQLEVPLEDSAVLVPERARVVEEVNQCFSIEIDAVSLHADPDLQSLLGKEATLRLLIADGSRRPWHGLVFEVARLGSDGGHARHRLVMRPWLSLLGLRRDNFLFQDLDVLGIVADVFKDYPQAQFRVDVNASLRKRSSCAQHNETDFAFVTRLLGEEGLSYHFEHLSDDEASKETSGKAHHRLVITDPLARRADLGSVRFAQSRDSASRFDLDRVDTLTHFSLRGRAGPSTVTVGSWNYKHLRGAQGLANSALPRGELPRLETYDGGGAYRYDDEAHAARAAAIELERAEQHYLRGEAQGSVRRLIPGAEFSLVEHASGNGRYAVLRVTHEVCNNLGSQAARLLEQHELAKGSYRCRTLLQPAQVPVRPEFKRAPTVAGSQTALIVGLAGEPLTTERDLRVKLQRHWQRGENPNPGGLPHDATSPDTRGNAPGNEASGTWTRTMQRAAGANFGMPFPPRHAAEVLVDHLDGHIDRPLVVGQLHNQQDRPPFAAGEGTEVNHPGVIAGVHSPTLDRSGYNEWVLDDHQGQLRMRLLCSYTAAEMGLGHLIRQSAADGQRGAARGQGLELGTQGWGSYRAWQGLLVSTTVREGRHNSVASTQMDAAEALGLLQGAQDLGKRLNDAAKPVQAKALDAHEPGQTMPNLIKSLDPKQDGKYPGPVNGQEARKADAQGQLTDPVERPATPTAVFDSSSALAAVSEAGIASMAAQDQVWVSQSDWHETAGRTASLVAGQTASWYACDNGIQLKAAHGPVSLRAHTDELRLFADKDVQIVSVNDEITITAQTRVEFTGGNSQVVLDGGNIDFKTPGTFRVLAASHNWDSAAKGSAEIERLPDTTVKLYDEAFALLDPLGKPLTGIPFKITASDGFQAGASSDDGQTTRVSTRAAEQLTFELRWHQLET